MNTQSAPTIHTPGPWITDTGEVPNLGEALGVLKKSHKPGEKGESICVVALTKDAEPHDYANARLIAAAPEMLEALLAVLRSISDPDGEHSVLEKIDAAVFKAFGQNARSETRQRRSNNTEKP